MLDTPIFISTEEQLTAVIHLVVPRAEIGLVMSPAITEIMAAIAEQGVEIVGPCFSYHLRRPSDIFDFEVGFPVNKGINAVGRVLSSTLPAANIVRTHYRGGYEGLAAAWGEFCAWMENQELKVQDSLWECYQIGPESTANSDDWCTELNRPLFAKPLN